MLREIYPVTRYVQFGKIVKEKVSASYYHMPKTVGDPQEAFHSIIAITECYRETQEVLGFLSLNTKDRVIGCDIVSKGNINSSIADPRDIFKTALLNGATSIILFHNHPSEDPSPSKEDINVTKRMMKAGELLQITVLDHIIVGNETEYSSLKEKGLI